MDLAKHLLDPDTTVSEIYPMISHYLASCEDQHGQLWLTADKITADHIWVE